jgi:hypothetical protein
MSTVERAASLLLAMVMLFTPFFVVGGIAALVTRSRNRRRLEAGEPPRSPLASFVLATLVSFGAAAVVAGAACAVLISSLA